MRIDQQGLPVASQRVADILAERILDGTLVLGTRIKQDELAEELNTSRIPVRDALRMLETRGLATLRANAGARVVAAEHRLLIEAVERYDAETATAVLVMHIRRTRVGLRKYSDIDKSEGN